MSLLRKIGEGFLLGLGFWVAKFIFDWLVRRF